MTNLPDLDWFKSSYSSAQGDSCVEVALSGPVVHVRDSKDVARPALTVGRDGWERFLSHTCRR